MHLLVPRLFDIVKLFIYLKYVIIQIFFFFFFQWKNYLIRSEEQKRVW
jgi:hypothetical protein